MISSIHPYLSTLNSPQGKCTFLSPRRSRRKAQRSLVWSLKSLMNGTAHHDIHDLSQPLATQRQCVWKSDLPPSGHASYIPLKDEWDSTPEWLKTKNRIRFSVAFSLTLRKPREQTTVVSDSFTGNVKEKRKLLCRHWKFTSDSHPLPKFLCVMTAWKLHIGIGMVCTVLSQEFWAIVWGLRITNW